MNVHEERFWKVLRDLGARETKIGGKHALDLSPIRLTTGDKLALFCQAFNEVVGRSNANRRHVDRRGCPVFVVTDFYTLNGTTAPSVTVTPIGGAIDLGPCKHCRALRGDPCRTPSYKTRQPHAGRAHERS